MHKFLHSEGTYLDQNCVKTLAHLSGMPMGMIMDGHLNIEPRRLAGEGWSRNLWMSILPIKKIDWMAYSRIGYNGSIRE